MCFLYEKSIDKKRQPTPRELGNHGDAIRNIGDFA